jgi:UDP-N-acetylmuramoyl-tripeptide--D-alanyl-D-alanine ligase
MVDGLQWTCSVEELAKAVSGQVMSKPIPNFSMVGTDTRQSLTGRLFIPLKGENFDAHDFVGRAIEQGATCVLVQGWRPEWDTLKARVSFVQVSDTLRALQDFGRHWRRKHNYKVIAITGSNGKTSTKEFTYAILKRHFKVHASKGSFNNHWGVPLSILAAQPSDTHLILEMGMNHAGEIRRLCQIAEPNIAIVTTVGRAHIGELGSQENVAKAKEEIYDSTPSAVHVFNMDNEWTMRMQARSDSKQIQLSGFKSAADVHLRAQRMNWDGLDLVGQIQGVKGQVWVPILGRHNVSNLMAAAGLALAAGVRPDEIWKDLGQIRETAWGRNQMLPLKNGARVLFDAYNANPDSVGALTKNLYEMDIAGRKFLIIGDMRELGSFSDQAHEEIGEKLAAIGVEGIWFVGTNSKAFWRGVSKVKMPAHHFTSEKVDKKISQEFLALLKEGDLVAVKGSRGMQLEYAIEQWPLTTPLGKKD